MFFWTFYVFGSSLAKVHFISVYLLSLEFQLADTLLVTTLTVMTILRVVDDSFNIYMHVFETAGIVWNLIFLPPGFHLINGEVTYFIFCSYFCPRVCSGQTNSLSVTSLIGKKLICAWNVLMISFSNQYRHCSVLLTWEMRITRTEADGKSFTEYVIMFID